MNRNMQDGNAEKRARRAVSSEVAEFKAFFHCIHGCDPFPWQTRLMEQVLVRGGWPRVIDLPTGAGKTAVLDIAIFAMSCRPDTSPRRIVFVIDRRIVVDQVYKRAQMIRDGIKNGNADVLAKVRARLRKIGGDEPLGVTALRGGVPIDSEWARRPEQPWAMVSTVDQFGSRLLFRGYGTSRSMRPVHAGLAGNDCLVILDEVHLSIPFARTLTHVAQLESPRMPRRFEVVEMSATPNATDAERFKLDPATDLDGCEELSRRVKVVKNAELITVRNCDAIPGAVLKRIKSIDGKTGSMQSVGVVVNTVATARNTYRALRDAGYGVFLITGRMRPLDRADVLDRIKHIVDPDREEVLDGLAVVVATQAIEVGADFSFDGMITECAAVDSLRQRFGRLDRRGRHNGRDGLTRAWIIGPKSTTAATKPDPIYGGAIKSTWKELERRQKEGCMLDVGSLAWDDFTDEAAAPRLDAPRVQKTHMDAWIQTHPEPIVQPSIEWFLHGIESQHVPDVSIVWRMDRSEDVMNAVPPRQAECVQVSIEAARKWLADKNKSVQDGIGSRDDGAQTGWILWRGSDGTDRDPATDKIRPGDTIVADPDMGGLMDGTWDPSSTDPVDDLGDYAQMKHAQMQHGGKITLRLDPGLIRGSPPKPSDESRLDMPVRERITQWIEEQRNSSEGQGFRLGEIIKCLGSDFAIIPVDVDGRSDEGYYVLAKKVVDTTTMQGTDESESQIGTGVTLKAHLEGVGTRARDAAKRLNLPDAIADDLYLAGTLHDIGKVDSRFQEQLVGGDPVEMEMQEEPLAKSLLGVRGAKIYPMGMRHEVASVAMLESNRAVLGGANDRDLVLYLIGTHHGRGRPLPPIIRDPRPQTLTYTHGMHRMESSSDLTAGCVAASMAERFWHLTNKYGYYGLAWLEAIFRLADHQQSAEEGTR